MDAADARFDEIPASAAHGLQSNTPTSLLVLAIMLFGGALMRTVFGPLQEAAKLGMALTDFQMSLVQGIAAGIPVAIFSLPIAWVINHGRRVRLLALLMAICAIGTLWSGLAGGFFSLFCARMLASLGATCGLAVVISLAADLCAPEKRGRALLPLSISMILGSAIAFLLGGKLLGYFTAHPLVAFGSMAPWRATHLTVGVIGTVLLFPLLALREPPRHEVEDTTHAFAPALRALWAKRRFLLPLFTGQLGVSMADAAAIIWVPPVLIRHFHQQPSQFGAWVGALLLFTGLLGSALGGLSADWGHKTGKRGAIFIGAIGATVIGIPAALYPLMPSVVSFCVLFGVLMMCGALIGLVVSTSVTVLIPNEERGACMAAFGIVNSIIGMSLAPMLVTLTSTALGGEQHLGKALAIVGVLASLLSMGGYLLAMYRAPTLKASV